MVALDTPIVYLSDLKSLCSCYKELISPLVIGQFLEFEPIPSPPFRRCLLPITITYLPLHSKQDQISFQNLYFFNSCRIQQRKIFVCYKRRHIFKAHFSAGKWKLVYNLQALLIPLCSEYLSPKYSKF